MKPVFILCALLCLVLLASCKLDDPESLAQKDIRDILYDISLDFNLGNVYGMMNHVDNDYLHKGKITWHLNQEILDRMGRFQLLEIEVLYIEINGNYAVAHTIDHYSSSLENVDYNEPEDSGYFSYFHRRQGSWLIYGNQGWIKSRGSDPGSGQPQIAQSEAF
ncbi:MAG: hypothetical protein LHW64_06170 [Candidatus Cloacimonetes bacterium]|jgi:hypothetical protein|nr:hypothetical protein [Candidatus Cloacimonadota bacterium]MCB5287369.1 hypothetical protein [Candidatus Cloacimonadota bacterium]MCK9184328.1 hypothetical protein [Candidatus Cloacimonadota bacterium]MCK9583819.1 hypothetical protein [Candidatus Cloacimonadota bacterium]MDY0229691.1 hypothetical protein [Candidatus Cloacimonadaceae bacterium]